MKRLLSALLMVLLIVVPLTAAPAEELPLPADLQAWLAAFQAEFLNSDPSYLPPTIPVQGWPVYAGGDWSIQYPADWTGLSGDAYSFLVCDSRRLACYDYVQTQHFPQALLHDQLGVYALSRVLGNASFQVVGTFQKNLFPQLMLPAPSGIAQVYYVKWQLPQAGNMFTLLKVHILSYFSSYVGGSTHASWTSFTAPEDEFLSMWNNVFGPMVHSSTYTIPRDGGTSADSDGDGYPDTMDEYPQDPYRH